MHHDAYSLKEARLLKRQDKQLPDPTGPLSFIIPAEAIRDANDAHIITWSGAAAPLRVFHSNGLAVPDYLLPLTESTNPGGVRGGKCKQSRDS